MQDKRLTVCVTGAGAGVDNVWEQKKLEARKMLVNRAESPASSARFVRQPARWPEPLPKKTTPQTWLNFTRNFDFDQNAKEPINQNACWKKWTSPIKTKNEPERKFWRNWLWQKTDKANEAETILQTEFTKTYVEKRQANFENLQNQARTKPKKRTCANVTWSKDSLNNHKPQLTRTLTNSKNKNWKDRAKFTDAKNWKPEPKWTKRKTCQNHL